jgi:hypothetical protein
MRRRVTLPLICAAVVVLAAARRPTPTAEARAVPPIPADPRVAYFDRLCESRMAIGRDLAEGRATLKEAAERMRDLDQALPPEGLRPAYPAGDEQLAGVERHSRTALRFARCASNPDPACRERIDRWERELAEGTGAEGRVILARR